MAHYLITGSYTSEAWAAQIKDPQNRFELVKPLFESQGGSIESAYFAFGDYDIVAIAQFPDNISAASIAIAVAAGGGLSNVKTVPLMSIEDGLEALKRAGGVSYTPAGS